MLLYLTLIYVIVVLLGFLIHSTSSYPRISSIDQHYRKTPSNTLEKQDSLIFLRLNTQILYSSPSMISRRLETSLNTASTATIGNDSTPIHAISSTPTSVVSNVDFKDSIQNFPFFWRLVVLGKPRPLIPVSIGNADALIVLFLMLLFA